MKIYTINRDNDGNFSVNVDESTGSASNEHLILTLNSNQGSSDMDSLNGVKVTINEQEYTWQGTTIEVDVPLGTTYNITFGDLENYTKPEDIIGLEATDLVRNISATYETSVITVRFNSNQSNPDSDLNGLIVRVDWDGGTTNLTYDGSDMTIKSPIGRELTFTSDSAESRGYTTPSAQKLTVSGVNHLIILEYNSCAVTIKVASNNRSDLLSGVEITIKYEDQTKVLSYQGSDLIFKIPQGTSYTITGSDIPNPDIRGQINDTMNTNYFKTPDSISDTATGANMTKELRYLAELLTVNVTGIGYSDSATIDIWAGIDGGIYCTFEIVGAGDGTTSRTFSTLIPYEQGYRGVCHDSSNGLEAEDIGSVQSLITASQDSRTFDVVYEESGIQIIIDRNSSDPAVEVKGDPTSLLSKFRRCLCTSNGSGVDITFLDDNNSNYYEDGSAATLTGAQGDVMVYFPEFWYLGETTENQHKIRFSEEEKDGYVHVPSSLVGAYKSTLSGDTLYSRSNSIIYTNFNDINDEDFHSDINSYAKNHGNEYHLIDYQQHCIIACMFMLRYKTRDPRLVGTGTNEFTSSNNKPSIRTGCNDGIGIKDTTSISASLDSRTMINFLGLEGCWGYIHEILEGIHAYQFNTIAYDKGWYGLVDSGSLPQSASKAREIDDNAGYITDIYGGSQFDLVSIKGGGSSSTYFCSYFSGGSSADTASFIRAGGTSEDSEYGGPFYLYYLGRYQSQLIGTRLAYDGAINILSNEEYKKKW